MRVPDALLIRRYRFETECQRLSEYIGDSRYSFGRLRRTLEGWVEGMGVGLLTGLMWTSPWGEVMQRTRAILFASVAVVVVLTSMYAIWEAPTGVLCTDRRRGTPVNRRLVNTFASLAWGWCLLVLYYPISYSLPRIFSGQISLAFAALAVFLLPYGVIYLTLRRWVPRRLARTDLEIVGRS